MPESRDLLDLPRVCYADLPMSSDRGVGWAEPRHLPGAFQ
jgi:hypothetical protein